MNALELKRAALAKEYDQLVESVDGLLAKGEDFNADDSASVQDKQARQQELRKEIETTDRMIGEHRSAKQFAQEPIALSTGVTALGAVNPVQVYREVNDKGTTIHAEELAMDEKTLAAISEPGYERAYRAYLKPGGERKMDAHDLATLREGTDTEGGYLVPVQWLKKLISKAPAPTRIRGRVERYNVTGPEIKIPRVVYATDDIYTTGVRVILTGETPSSSTVHRVTDPVFGVTRITVGTWMMSTVLSKDFQEDGPDPLQLLFNKFYETEALLEDNQILNGTGIGAYPHGILKNPGGTNEPAVTLSSTANDIDATQIRQLPYDLAEQYINENTAWFFSRGSVGKKLAGMAGVSGEFIFRLGEYDNGLGMRHPDTLNGDPILYSAFCPTIGDGIFAGGYGDLKGYALADRVGLSLQVLHETQAANNQFEIVGRKRFGGVVAEPFRLRILKSDNA